MYVVPEEVLEQMFGVTANTPQLEEKKRINIPMQPITPMKLQLKKKYRKMSPITTKNKKGELIYYNVNEFYPMEHDAVEKLQELRKYEPQESGYLHKDRKKYNLVTRKFTGVINGYLTAPKETADIFTNFLNEISKDPIIRKYAPSDGVRLTDSYRTFEVQANAYDKKPKLALPAGMSQHNIGYAIDFGLRDIINNELVSKYGLSLNGCSNPALVERKLTENGVPNDVIKFINDSEEPAVRMYRAALALSEVYNRVREIGRNNQVYNPFEEGVYEGSSKAELWHWQVGHNPNLRLKQEVADYYGYEIDEKGNIKKVNKNKKNTKISNYPEEVLWQVQPKKQ